MSLMLKKSRHWIEANKKQSLIIFKTANMTITYYTSTSTLQFRENKASDSTTHIKWLKDIHPEALPSTILPETNINDRDALLNSSLDLSSESSNNSSVVANFNPEIYDIKMYQMDPWRVIPFVRSMKMSHIQDRN